MKQGHERAGRRGAALAAALLALACQPAMAQPTAEAPSFRHDPALSSNTGHARIAWDSEHPVTLEIARDPAFSSARALYRGGNHAYFLSGLAEGEYHLRLRDSRGETSDPITLSVAHQSLRQALWLTAIGAIIAIAIVVTILRGARP